MDPRQTGMYDSVEERILIPRGPCYKLLTHHRAIVPCTPRCIPGGCTEHCPPPRIKGDPEEVWNTQWTKVPGVASVDILPPKRNRYPIIKGTFTCRDTKESFSAVTLCKECTELNGPKLGSQFNCTHPDELRAFHVSLTFEEAVYALSEEQGYELLRVHEVQWFVEAQEDVFDKFLGLFAREKVINSGWGDTNVDDANERQRFVEKLREETGFDDIEEDEIQDCEPLRSSAKQLLVATIGKQVNCKMNKSVSL